MSEPEIESKMISSYLDEVDQLRSSVPSLKSEVERLRAERSDLYQWFEHRHVTGDLTLEQIDAMSPKDMADHAYQRKSDQLDKAQRELKEAQAAAAVMREACGMDSPLPVFDVLEQSASWLGNLQIIHDCDCHGRETIQPLRLASQQQSEAIKKALSTTAGTAFLARMAEAEWLVECAVFANPRASQKLIADWKHRHDAFLKGGGEVRTQQEAAETIERAEEVCRRATMLCNQAAVLASHCDALGPIDPNFSTSRAFIRTDIDLTRKAVSAFLKGEGVKT